MSHLQQVIEEAWNTRDAWNSEHGAEQFRGGIEKAITLLDDGGVRIAEKDAGGNWVTNEWLKKAVLLYFKLNGNKVINGGSSNYYDKVPLKFTSWGEDMFRKAGIRVAPPATVRKGAYIAPKAVLMPSYVNIGAYVDEGTMVDTWATVGSCAQIGKHVHLSGGVGIGGVLEPLQATPTIIEDDCFIGARSEIVEGVVVRQGAVISMGVFIGRSTRIYNREKDEISYGEVPPYSVVVSGSMPGKSGGPNLYCAVIVKQVDERTRSKTGITELLREF